MFTLRRFDVPVLAAEPEPLRVLHLSDLHLTPGQHRKQRWVASLAGADPDLVVVTGDNLAHPEAIPAVARALGPLLDLPGAFVFGSNDYGGPVWKNPLGYLRSTNPGTSKGSRLPTEDLRAMLTGAGWVDLNNARTTVKAGGRTVELVGVDDPHIDCDDYPSVAGPVSADADVHMAVTHTPEPSVLDAMAADGFSLLLAGHTHGGQVCVPGFGALVTNCGLDRRMAKGLHPWRRGTRRLAARLRRGRHPPDRPGPVRLPPRGFDLDPDPPLIPRLRRAGDTGFAPPGAWATMARHTSGCGAAW